MSSAPPDSDVLVRVENVSKKFCRSLKKSLWYGVTDVASALNPFSSSSEAPTTKHQPQGTKHEAQSTNNIPLRPDEFWAVQNVSFELRRGECLGLIGHNGAGKSTLLKVLNGLIPPDTGRITMKGRVCALIELNAGFNPILSGRENIFNQAALLGFNKEETLEKFDAIVDFAEIGDFLDMPVQNYSSGMRVRLGFAVAAQMEPDVLIIDEVLAVGDVAFRFKCLNAIGEIMRSAAVIFVTHTMPQVFRICNEVIVLDHGKVTYQGDDLAEGVGEYLSLFKGSDSTLAGSGEVRVNTLELESGNAMAIMGSTLRIPYGAALTVHTQLAVNSSLESVRIQFLFWSAEMLPVLELMGDGLQGHLFDCSRKSVDVTAMVPRLELNSGKYSLSVIAVSADYAQLLCRHDNVAYLQVDAKAPSGAYAISVADWSIG